MLKFNNDNIFTGYLKQILASFNLPKYRIYTKENQLYHNWAVEFNKKIPLENAKRQQFNNNLLTTDNSNGLQKQELLTEVPLEKNIIETVYSENSNYPNNIRYALYLKDSTIQMYVNSEWKATNFHYHFNKKELNQTQKFKIKNNIYDTYTHEYLGNFLRFIRDYYDLDLMPLYNCFSNKICPKLDIKSAENKFEFNTDDLSYKIYMIPVKLFKKYTIAIDCNSPIELCCGVYGAYQDTRLKLKSIPDLTYLKLDGISFRHPIIFDKLCEDNLAQELIKSLELAQNEDDLKLFIKLPIWNNSSITILEGDYSGYNNYIIEKSPNKIKKINNHSITNYNETEAPDIQERQLNLITDLQLLKFNTGTSYPFADKLIDYLSGNVITHIDPIEDNISRVQSVMSQNEIYFDANGLWDAKIRPIIYDYMNSDKNVIKSANHDILGYIDKDVEKLYVGAKTNNRPATSISNAYIYPELYIDYQKSKEDKK